MENKADDKSFEIGEVVKYDYKLCTVIDKIKRYRENGSHYDYFLLGEDGIKHGLVNAKHMERTDKNQNYSCETRKKLFNAVINADKKHHESVKGTREDMKTAFENSRDAQKEYNTLLRKCKLYDCQKVTDKEL